MNISGQIPPTVMEFRLEFRQVGSLFLCSGKPDLRIPLAPAVRSLAPELAARVHLACQGDPSSAGRGHRLQDCSCLPDLEFAFHGGREVLTSEGRDTEGKVEHPHLHVQDLAGFKTKLISKEPEKTNFPEGRPAGPVLRWCTLTPVGHVTAERGWSDQPPVGARPGCPDSHPGGGRV